MFMDMRTTPTVETITESQIRDLRSAAQHANDWDMSAICDVALEGPLDADDYSALSSDSVIRGLSQEQARARCAQVIADAHGSALFSFASEFAEKHNVYLMTALKMIRDDPGEAARETRLTTETVVAWCMERI